MRFPTDRVRRTRRATVSPPAPDRVAAAPDPRVRIVLLVAVALVVVYLARVLSQDEPALAGSNRVAAAVFAASVPPGGVLCQAVGPLPDDAAAVGLTIGTYGRPVPAARLRLVSPTGAVSAEGQTTAALHEGPISIPVRRHPDAPAPSQLCLRFAGHTRVVVAGTGVPPGPGTARIDGALQGEIVSVTYYRGHAQSWASGLATLAERFGRGKAGWFGDWTLAACALALLAVWACVVRLLARELT